ncbi:hypothetical protein FLB_17380 [Flavobacterium succinicans]|uniref:Uncharacterized protein n=1 Tax=Flavobacterium succinicans TaxID=29536 RepID=A0A199XS18_9FLAO|nr:hypothetical protein FLB_17380 [Flavobacterium succinicans]
MKCVKTYQSHIPTQKLRLQEVMVLKKSKTVYLPAETIIS